MRRHKKGNFWCCTTTQTVNPEYFDGTFAVHRLSAPQHSFYSPVCGITMRDERIRGLKIHEETQEEAKIKGKNLKTIILLTAPGRLVDAQIQTHKKSTCGPWNGFVRRNAALQAEEPFLTSMLARICHAECAKHKLCGWRWPLNSLFRRVLSVLIVQT